MPPSVYIHGSYTVYSCCNDPVGIKRKLLNTGISSTEFNCKSVMLLWSLEKNWIIIYPYDQGPPSHTSSTRIWPENPHQLYGGICGTVVACWTTGQQDKWSILLQRHVSQQKSSHLPRLSPAQYSLSSAESWLKKLLIKTYQLYSYGQSKKLTLTPQLIKVMSSSC